MTDPFDIRSKTYREEIAEYLEGVVTIDSLEPREFTKGLTPHPGPVNTEDYPAGTWFTWFEGEVYVR